MSNPRQYKIPDWFLNRQKDVNDGKYSQVLANQLDNKLREDLERLKKIRAHRGLRHYWGYVNKSRSNYHVLLLLVHVFTESTIHQFEIAVSSVYINIKDTEGI